MALNTVLGFDASDAISNLNALVAALSQYNAAIGKSAGATQAFNQAGKGVTEQTKGIDAAQRSWNEYGKTVSRLPATHPVMVAQRKLTESLSNTTQKATQQMILSWKSVIRIFTIQIIHQIISKLTSAMVESAEAARKFGIAIAEVHTISDELGETFESLRAEAVRVSEALGQPLDVVAEAQYQLFSDQVGNARQSLEVFTAAQKLSIAAVSSLDDAVLLLTGTINAYGFSTSEAETIAAKYFRTIEVGRVRADELANTMGRVNVTASQLGIEFDEVLATIASLTITGMDADEALTLLSNIMMKLIRPTDTMKEAFAELSVESAEAGIQIYGFQGFLQKLRDTTQGTATEMGELFGRIRGTRGALGITGAAAEKYAERLKIIKEATVELLNQKLELIWETNAKQVQIELNKLSVATTEGFGRGINIVLQKIFDTFGGAVGTIKALTATLLTAGSTFLLIKTGAITSLMAIVTGAKTATVAIKAMGAALVASPVAWAAAVAVATVTVIALYDKATAAAKKNAQDTIEANESAKDNYLKSKSLELSRAAQAAKKIVAEQQKSLHELVKLEMEAANKAASVEERAFDSLHDRLKDRLSSIEGFVNKVIAVANSAAAAIRQIEQESAGVKRSLEAFNFERQIKGLSEQRQIMELISKSADLRRKASEAARKNDEKSAKALSQQSQDYANQALQTADSSKNSALIRRAEEGVRSSLQGEIDLNNDLIKNKKDQAQIAKASLPDLYSQSATIKEMVERFNKLKYEAGKAKTPEEFIKTFREMSELAGQIDQKFQEFTAFKPLAVKLDLEDSFETATQALLEGLTGREMNLSDAVYFDSVQIAKTLQTTLTDAQKQVSIQVEALTGVKGARLQQTALTQLPEQLDTARKSEEARLEATKTVEQAQSNLDALLVTQNLQLQESVGLWDKIKFLASWQGITAPKRTAGGPLPTAEEIAPDITAINQYIAALSRQTLEMIRQRAPAEDIKRNLDAIAIAEGQIKRAGFTEAANAIKAIFTELSKQEEAQMALDALTGSANIFKGAMEEAALGITEADAQVAAGTVGFQQSMEARAASAEAAARRIIAAMAAANAAAASAPVTESLGGYIHRATGGSVGTDTVPAMLTPGEFVVNAAATRKFYSQLIAMNSGIKPIFRQEGGPVTTIGDINISVNESVNPQQTAREIISSIRREMRRGTATLR